MIRFYFSVFLLISAFSMNSCGIDKTDEQNAIASFENFIPAPVAANRTNDFYQIRQNENIVLSASDPVLLRLADYLTVLLKPVAICSVSTTAAVNEQRGIHLNLVNDSSLKEEGYELIITDRSVTVNASRPAGIFYGIQTLRQLLPPITETKMTSTPCIIAAGTIRDYPQYAIRGSMLDVARHFFSVEDVKRYIDFLAAYKMNTFHLHLSDDQGWRIEIKKWPELTAFGGSTQVGGGNGGFYTQEQYKEIVHYAAERFITVIPEIDMPGHTNAALASYPQLNCNPKDPTPKLYTGTDVGFSTLCTADDKVYAFIDDVFAELSAITPGPYIHIGGDESLVTPKEEYIRFINRVQGIVKKYNKQVIGWDEIANATLQPNTIAQYWSDSTNPLKAVQQGAKIIMSPAKYVYLDMKYDSATQLGQNWASYIEIDQAYNWNPATLVKGIDQKDIRGIIAPLWTETIATMKDIEYMVFPRLPGYAEIAWSPSAKKNWEGYKNRLAYHGLYLKASNINFYKSKLINWKE